MITARPQKSLKAARNYFRAHLARGDYYSQGRTIPGFWIGRGAVRLGLDLAAPVTETAFLRLCENRHPHTGAQLTVRQRQKNRRVFYDFVVSAPKSVSIMALTAGDTRIIAAHVEAARIAMQHAEAAATARIRAKGQRSERITGEIAAAAFGHEESRALDPQLHHHFVVFNATWDPVETRWKALEPSAMFDRINLFTEIYRNELASRLRVLGYRLHRTSNGFEIEGVSPALIQRFSKRRRAILEIEEKLTQGRPLSKNARAALARGTRPPKRRDLSAEQIVAYQRSQLRQDELATLERLKNGQPGGSPPNRGEAARAAIDYARDHLFERQSAVPKHQLLREALHFALGEVSPKDLQTELEQRTEFISVGDMLTTREALRQEQRLIALVDQGIGGCQPLRPNFRSSEGLSAEQDQALRFLLHSQDEVIVLRGRAGTGKTRLLKELVRHIEERYAVITLAPTAAAVDVLHAQGLRQSATVQRFLVDEEFQRASTGRAIIVDEAGFLSLNDLTHLVEITRTNRCRLILSGDSRQHSGVEAGDALRVLEEHSQLRPVELKNIQRQVNLEYRQAIADLAQGHAQPALNRLERLGAVAQLEDENVTWSWRINTSIPSAPANRP